MASATETGSSRLYLISAPTTPDILDQYLTSDDEASPTFDRPDHEVNSMTDLDESVGDREDENISEIKRSLFADSNLQYSETYAHDDLVSAEDREDNGIEDLAVEKSCDLSDECDYHFDSDDDQEAEILVAETVPIRRLGPPRMIDISILAPMHRSRRNFQIQTLCPNRNASAAQQTAKLALSMPSLSSSTSTISSTSSPSLSGPKNPKPIFNAQSSPTSPKLDAAFIKAALCNSGFRRRLGKQSTSSKTCPVFGSDSISVSSKDDAVSWTPEDSSPRNDTEDRVEFAGFQSNLSSLTPPSPLSPNERQTDASKSSAADSKRKDVGAIAGRSITGPHRNNSNNLSVGKTGQCRNESPNRIARSTLRPSTVSTKTLHSRTLSWAKRQEAYHPLKRRGEKLSTFPMPPSSPNAVLDVPRIPTDHQPPRLPPLGFQTRSTSESMLQ